LAAGKGAGRDLCEHRGGDRGVSDQAGWQDQLSLNASSSSAQDLVITGFTPADRVFHPLAGLFPLLEGAEADAFGDDIKNHGLREPIVLLDEQILDGRNRYLQCRRVGAEPTFRPFCDDDPVAYVISLNLKRRHLNESQRAWVASKIATLGDGQRQVGKFAEVPSQSDAANMLNVSERSVRSAAAVRDHGSPELQHAVEHGHLAVSAAAKAANLPVKEEREIAEKATAGDANAARTVLKKSVRAAREADLGAKQIALPAKKFEVILADPAWDFAVYSRETGMDRAAENHYPTQSLEAIKALDVASISADDAALFLWATVPKLPQALETMSAWGFTYRTHFVWLKDKAGTGYWNRNRHELLLVGTRGNIPAPAPGTQSPSVIEAPVGAHSAKPEAFLELIETHFPNLPKIELNARKRREGWSAWAFEAPVIDETSPEDAATLKNMKSLATAHRHVLSHKGGVKIDSGNDDHEPSKPFGETWAGYASTKRIWHLLSDADQKTLNEYFAEIEATWLAWKARHPDTPVAADDLDIPHFLRRVRCPAFL
jgi:N6-adenosine-specific RNA methylase IME4